MVGFDFCFIILNSFCDKNNKKEVLCLVFFWLFGNGF